MTLVCSVSGGGDVSYTWYRGSEQILTPRNLSSLEEQIDVDVHGSQMYTCNVSNPVSWANQTLKLSQGCLNAHHSEWRTVGQNKAVGAGPVPRLLCRRSVWAMTPLGL